MGIKTAGTRIFVRDPSDDTIVAILCVTSIDGIDETVDEIEVTCLEDLVRRFQSGLKSPTSFTFGIQTDPSDPTHARLIALKDSGVNTDWIIAWPGEGVPTLDVDGSLVLPDTRTFTLLEGYISSFPLSFGLNDVVRSEISVRLSGPVVTVPQATPTP